MTRGVAVLVVMLLGIPPGTSFHQEDPSSDRPYAPHDPLIGTGIIPLDRAQQEFQESLNELLDFGYDNFDDASRPAVSLLPQQPVTLYVDGMKDDVRRGALGPWRVLVNDGWGPHEVAAFEGNWGMASGPGGPYAVPADGVRRTVLVAPELDLRTGFGLRDAVAQRDAWGDARDVLQDPLFLVEFHHRFNLGAGRDGVEMWIMQDEPKGVQDVQSCSVGCTKVAPHGGSYSGTVSAIGGAGFTGSQDWQRVVLDLTDWAEQRVWLVFRQSVSSPPFSGYFGSDAYFDHTDWYGYHIDELRLHAGAPHANLQVRELDDPTQMLPGRSTPTLDRAKEIPVRSVLRNTGGISIDVEATLRIEDRNTGQTLAGYQRTLQAHLRPGEVFRVDELFPPVGVNASLRAVVTGTTVGVNGTVPESAAGDNQAAQAFNVLRHRDVRLSEPQRQAAWIERGRMFNHTAAITNFGTIPEEVTVLATLLDVRNGHAVADHLLLPGHGNRTYLLAPGETRDLRWTVSGEQPGQYRLFVRTSDQAPFSPLLVLPPGAAPQAVPYVEGAVTVDGALAEAAWSGAASRVIEFVGTGGPRTVTMRAMHDGQALYLAFVVPDATEDTATAGDEDLLALYFDDLGDQILVHGEEDGVRIGNRTSIEVPSQRLVYDAHAMWWVAAGPAAGDVQRVHRDDALTGQAGYVYEVRRPIAGDGMLVGPGGLVGWYGQLGERNTDAQGQTTAREHAYPSSALTVDGQGSAPPNGRLDDEVATWALMHLEPLPTQEARIGDWRLALGFGVDMGSPMAFFMDTRDGCPSGWRSEGFMPQYPSIVKSGRDGWHCASYPPEGRDLFYLGMGPDSECGEKRERCLPYNGGTNGLGESVRNRAVDPVLTTPPITIPDIPAPYLMLEHQYSTRVSINDRVPEGVDYGGVIGVRPGNARLFISNIGWVSAQVLDENGEWGEEIYLVPEGGYDTENTVSIHTDADCGPRKQDGRCPIADPRNDPVGRDLNDFSNIFCKTANPGEMPVGAENCGWWHPAGLEVGYRPLDDVYPGVGVFAGSPWKVDRVALKGTHPTWVDGHGGTAGAREVDLAGKTVRFSFTFGTGLQHGNILAPSSEIHKDIGWRIASVGIVEGAVPVRDLAVQRASVATPYDASALGLGPGTEVPLRATLRNDGNVTIAAGVRFVGIDVAAQGSVLCQGTVKTATPLEPGAQEVLRFPCLLPPDSAGAKVMFRAELDVPGGDDIPFNDVARVRGAFDVRASPDAGVDVRITPQRASSDFVRTVTIGITNAGNVPLEEFTLQQWISRGPIVVQESIWRCTVKGGAMPVNVTWQHGDPRLVCADAEGRPMGISDRFFDPAGRGGDHAIIARVLGVTGDVGAGNDLAGMAFQAADVLYSDDFRLPPRTPVAGIVRGEKSFGGTPGVWSVQADGARHVLRAGDVVSGELPEHTDAWLRLPSMDLTTAKGATVNIRHNHSLEQGYDGARLEVSTDGGTTWSVVVPKQGPGGYPVQDARGETMVLAGATPLLEGAAEARGVAFTGDSPDMAGGWAISEFDLGTARALQEHVPVAHFELTDLEARPTGAVTDALGDLYFVWPGDEPLDGWLVDNATRNDPKPRSGTRMWWSGSAGETTPDRIERVETSLRIEVDLGASRPGELPVLSWYDWRAGWQDRDVAFEFESVGPREGTGGLFRLILEDEAGARHVMESTVRDRQRDGWTLREADLSEFVNQTVVLEFNYSSAQSSSFRDPATKNNEGWFIDDLAVTTFLVHDGVHVQPRTIIAHDMEGMVSPGCNGAGEFDVRFSKDLGPNGDKESVACWGLVERGADRDGAWHLDTVDGPGGQPVRAWRTASHDSQGYPNLVNSRLVTPPVDLAQLTGSSATLRFDHRYGFQDELVGDFRWAVDGGVVEYQVFDEATGRYSPWEVLVNTGSHDRLVLAKKGNVLDDLLSRQALENTGYPTLFPRGYVQTDTEDSVVRLAGRGAPFGHLPGICVCNNRAFLTHPVTPAFSGDSQGWRHADWDVSHLVGKQVRFAFHMWSNPQDPTPRDETFEGWTVTNIAVDGTVFRGAPVDLRLRVGTDGTVRDGHWEIDAIEVAADLYGRNVALDGPAADILLAADAEPVIPISISNLGTSGRQGLALLVHAQTDAGQVVPVNVTGPELTLLERHNVTVLDPGQGFAAFSLTRAGLPGASADAQIVLPDAPAGTDIRVSARIIEESATAEGQYGAPRDEVLGNTIRSWTMRLEDSSVLAFAPHEGSPLALVLAAPHPDGGLRLAAHLTNTGTLPGATPVDWTVRDDQDVIVWSNRSEATLPPGGHEMLRAHTMDLPPGLYTARVEVSGQAAQTLVPHKISTLAWHEGFGTAPLPTGWQASTGGITFSTARYPGFLHWGPDPVDGQVGYCAQLGCRAGNPGRGHESTATSGPIDTGLTINGQAELVIRHSVDFVRGRDGGRLEASPLVRESAGWRPLECGAGEHWVPLAPTGGLLHGGRTSSFSNTDTHHSRNPLGDGTPVFQGNHGSRQQPLLTRYDLRAQDTWCPGGEEKALLGQTLGLRFRIGIQDRDQAQSEDATGWSIAEAWIGSSSVSVGPRNDGSRDVHVPRNAAKAIGFIIENTGATWDRFHLAVAGLPPAWTGLEQEHVDLAPGQRATVAVLVDVPETAPPGVHGMTFIASSARDPVIQDVLPVILNVAPLPKADLGFSADAPIQVEGKRVADGIQVEQGTIVPVHASIVNAGLMPSKRADVLFEAVAADGTRSQIERRTLEPLCAPGHAGCSLQAATTTVTAEWATPAEPGDFTIEVTIDPDGRLLDGDRGNNLAMSGPVAVVPLQVPDLVLEDLVVLGMDADGFVEQGDLLVIRATVANRGFAPMPSSEVRILAGSVTLTERTLPMLVPGASMVVEAVKVAAAGSDGQIVVRAVVASTSVAESRVDNNEVRRLLTVRTHELAGAGPAAPVDASAGGQLSLPVQVHNGGNGVERVTFAAVDVPAHWQVRILPGSIAVPPSGSATAVVLVGVPQNATGGEHGFRVEARAGPAQTTIPVSVRIDAQRSPTSVEMLVHRVGTGPQEVTLRLASGSNVREELEIVSNGWLAFPTVHVSLGPGESREVHVPAEVPGWLAPGLRVATVQVASADGAWSVTRPVTLDVAPTLAAHATWQRLEPRAVAGDGSQEVGLTLRVENVGNIPFEVNLQASGLSDGATLRLPDAMHLQPNGTAAAQVQLRMPEGRPALAGHLDLHLQGAGLERVVRVPLPDIARLPDLRVTGLSVEYGKGIARLAFTVSNHGDAPSPPSTTHVYLDGLLVAAVDAPALEPGGSVALEAEVPVAGRGLHVVSVVADGGLDVLERRADDNGRSESIVVDETLMERVQHKTPPAGLAPMLALLGLVVLRRRRWTA